MTPLDFERRSQFCSEMLASSKNDPGLLDNILFSDESIFSLDKAVYAHNTYSWSDTNPHFYTQRKLQPERVVVWCGLSASLIIGPYFFPGTVTADSYTDMLRNYLVPGLRRRNILNTITFQQDGASPHTAHRVLEYLQQQFNGRLISFRTTTIWPPRSPDLNPLDFYLWGHIKQRISKMEWRTVEELKTSITTAVRSINRDKDLLKRVISSFSGRISMCLDAGGRHFENRLK